MPLYDSFSSIYDKLNQNTNTQARLQNPWAGMPDYLAKAAQRNLAQADQQINKFNQTVQNVALRSFGQNNTVSPGLPQPVTPDFTKASGLATSTPPLLARPDTTSPLPAANQGVSPWRFTGINTAPSSVAASPTTAYAQNDSRSNPQFRWGSAYQSEDDKRNAAEFIGAY